jgi:hypothetical protein
MPQASKYLGAGDTPFSHAYLNMVREEYPARVLGNITQDYPCPGRIHRELDYPGIGGHRESMYGQFVWYITVNY